MHKVNLNGLSLTFCLTVERIVKGKKILFRSMRLEPSKNDCSSILFCVTVQENGTNVGFKVEDELGEFPPYSLSKKQELWQFLNSEPIKVIIPDPKSDKAVIITTELKKDENGNPFLRVNKPKEIIQEDNIQKEAGAQLPLQKIRHTEPFNRNQYHTERKPYQRKTSPRRKDWKKTAFFVSEEISPEEKVKRERNLKNYQVPPLTTKFNLPVTIS